MGRLDRQPATWVAIAAASLAVLAAGCGGLVGVGRIIPRGVVLTPATARFEITGRTIDEIGASIRATSARRGGNIGSFSTSIRFSARFVQGGFGSADCRIVDVRLDLHAVIEIPAWQRPVDAEPSAIAAMEAFVVIVDDHERTHESIALQNAGDLVRTLERLRSLSCSTLQADANLEVDRASRAMRERQAQFDRDARNDPANRWPPPPPSTTKP
jgi:predicted secreted Zn-dependent protease